MKFCLANSWGTLHAQRQEGFASVKRALNGFTGKDAWLMLVPKSTGLPFRPSGEVTAVR